jgi:hypothetical protein
VKSELKKIGNEKDDVDETEGEIKENTKSTETTSIVASNALKRAVSQFVVIYGESGTGKSAFVTRLFDPDFCHQKGGAWEYLHNRILAKHICQVQDDETLDPLRWVQSLAGQLFLVVSGVGKMKEALAIGGHQDRDRFVEWLEKETSVRTILNEWVLPLLSLFDSAQEFGGMDTIVIDSLDEASTFAVLEGEDFKSARGQRSTGRTIVHFLLEYRYKWPSWVRFIATSRPDPDTKNILKPLTGARIDVKNDQEPMSMSCQQNLKDVREFLQLKLKAFEDWNYLPPFPDAVASVVFSYMNDDWRALLRMTCHSCRYTFDQVVEKICEKANGVFMYAKEVLSQLNENTFHVDLNALPKELGALYMKRYALTFPKNQGAINQYEEHSKPMLELLVVSRGMLPKEVVKSVGMTKSKKNNTMWLIERQRHLEFVQRMCVGSLVEVGMLQLSHKSFSDWLTSKKASGRFCVKRRRAEKSMAACCWEELGGGGGGGGNSSSSDNEDSDGEDGDDTENNGATSRFHKYALRHGVSHLIAAGRKEEARTLFLDVGWLMARAGEGVRLMEDCRLFKGDRVVELIESCVRLALADLRKDP